MVKAMKSRKKKDLGTSGENARERIIEAAQRLFAEKGFWGTSVQEITDGANVNKAMLFYYFKSKENLYFFLIDNILHDFLDTLKKRISESPDPMAKLTAFLNIYNEVCFRPKDFGVFKMIFQDIIGPGDRVKASLRGRMKDFLELIASVIEEGSRQGVFKSVDPQITALSLMGICYVLARHRLLLGEQFNTDDVTPYIHTLILEGIRL